MPTGRAPLTLESATSAACCKASRGAANHSVGPTCVGGNCPLAEEADGKLRWARPLHPRGREKRSGPPRNRHRHRETGSSGFCSTLRIDPESDSEAPARHVDRTPPSPLLLSAARRRFAVDAWFARAATPLRRPPLPREAAPRPANGRSDFPPAAPGRYPPWFRTSSWDVGFRLPPGRPAP